MVALDEGLAVDDGEMQKRWPALRVTVADFQRHLEGLPPSEDLRVDELYLAFAAGTGCDRAVEVIQRDYFGGVDLLTGWESASELRQQVSERLFVAPAGKRPRILEFQGKGSLARWIKVVASRLKVDNLRRNRPADPIDELADVAAHDDPELSYLRRESQADFKRALAEAVGNLAPRDRVLLRFRYVQGLPVDDIASIFGMHRVSVSRKLGRLHRQILADVRREFVVRGSRRDELDQMFRQFRSKLELSLSRLLAAEDG